MTIRFRQHVTLECEQGQEVDLPEPLASNFCMLGYAVPVAAEQPLETPEVKQQLELRAERIKLLWG